MKIRAIVVILLSAFLSGCSNPLPEDRLDYVGGWVSKEMSLVILQDGTVSYSRLKNGGTTSVNGPLKDFVGNDFVVGFWFLTTTFNVSEAPQQIEGKWQMVVDGVRLTKTDE